MSLDVLIADQDIDLARLYRRFLAGHGLSAQTAVNGLQCMGMVRRHAPGVLVLDHELAGGDAMQVLSWLRAGSRSMPVILTTWSTSSKAVTRLIETPILLCLRKFFPLPAMLEGVHLALSKGKPPISLGQWTGSWGYEEDN